MGGADLTDAESKRLRADEVAAEDREEAMGATLDDWARDDWTLDDCAPDEPSASPIADTPLGKALARVEGAVAESHATNGMGLSASVEAGPGAAGADGGPRIGALRRTPAPSPTSLNSVGRDVDPIAGIAEPARQLLLDLKDRPGPRARRILEADANALAIAVAEAPDRWRAGLACLVGPEGSGKTHLIDALYPEAERLRTSDCVDGFQRADWVAAGAVLAFDDLDQACRVAGGGAFEIALFHLLNMVADRGARLLITGRTPPSRWPIALPDLRTRLEAATLATIEAPDDVLLTALLKKLFDDRGLDVESAVIAYLVKRIDRTYAAAIDAVERLNAASLREKRAVTTPLAAEALGWRPSRY